MTYSPYSHDGYVVNSPGADIWAELALFGDTLPLDIPVSAFRTGRKVAAR
jgi:hypothetical protein